MLPDNLLMLALLAGGGYLAGSGLRVRRSVKNEAMEIASRLRAYGFSDLPSVFEAYATGDHKGFVDRVKYVAEVFRNEDHLKQELAAVIKRSPAKQWLREQTEDEVAD